MLKIEPDILNKTIVLRVEGKLTEKDYKDLLPGLEALMAKVDKVKFLILLHDFKGWDAKAFFEDVNFDARYRQHLGKIAIVGEHVWEELGARLANFFLPEELRYFAADQEAGAREWLKE